MESLPCGILPDVYFIWHRPTGFGCVCGTAGTVDDATAVTQSLAGFIPFAGDNVFVEVEEKDAVCPFRPDCRRPFLEFQRISNVRVSIRQVESDSLCVADAQDVDASGYQLVQLACDTAVSIIKDDVAFAVSESLDVFLGVFLANVVLCYRLQPV